MDYGSRMGDDTVGAADQRRDRRRRQAGSSNKGMVQLTTAVPLQYGTLLQLCGLYPRREGEKDGAAGGEKELWWKPNWRRNQWQMIEHYPNSATRVMALRIALVATLDDGTGKAEQIIGRILEGQHPDEEEIMKALGENAGLLPKQY